MKSNKFIKIAIIVLAALLAIMITTSAVGKEHNHCIISATEDCFEACRGQNYTYFPR